MPSLFDIGKSGLQAYRQSLAVTGQNIANVNTDGFKKREVGLQEVSGAGGGVTEISDQTGLGVRVENIRRASEVGKLFMENGNVVICSLVSPTIEIRKQAQGIIGEGFKEVFVNAPFDVCAERDVKGLYKKARNGEIKNFTGIDSPYEIPDSPSLIVDTEKENVEQSVEKIYAAIKNKIK